MAPGVARFGMVAPTTGGSRSLLMPCCAWQRVSENTKRVDGRSHDALKKKLHVLRDLKRSDGSLQARVSEMSVDVASSDDQQFVTMEEVQTLSESQVEFLIRKRKAAAGLGPLMPEASVCASCTGTGTCACHACDGTGLNKEAVADEMFEGEVYVRNGVLDPKWLFIHNGPCWLCRGANHIACRDCGGTGIKGGIDRFSGD